MSPAGVSEPYVVSGFPSSPRRDSVSGREIERRLVLGVVGEGGLLDGILQMYKAGVGRISCSVVQVVE